MRGEPQNTRKNLGKTAQQLFVFKHNCCHVSMRGEGRFKRNCAVFLDLKKIHPTKHVWFTCIVPCNGSSGAGLPFVSVSPLHSTRCQNHPRERSSCILRGTHRFTQRLEKPRGNSAAKILASLQRRLAPCADTKGRERKRSTPVCGEHQKLGCRKRIYK